MKILKTIPWFLASMPLSFLNIARIEIDFNILIHLVSIGAERDISHNTYLIMIRQRTPVSAPVKCSRRVLEFSRTVRSQPFHQGTSTNPTRFQDLQLQCIMLNDHQIQKASKQRCKTAQQLSLLQPQCVRANHAREFPNQERTPSKGCKNNCRDRQDIRGIFEVTG